MTDFVYRAALVIERRVAGRTTQQTVPFSFESLWAMAGLRGDRPGNPFDMTRWAIVARGRQAEVRYTFHTRNLEMQPILKRVSKATPQLRYAMVTHCLDDGDFGAFAARHGKLKGGWLGPEWQEPFWEATAKQHKVSLDDVYDDDLMSSVTESVMRDAAVKIAAGSDRRWRWTGGRVYRDLEDEREMFMVDLAQAIRKFDGADDRLPPGHRR